METHFFDMDGSLALYERDTYLPYGGKPWYEKLKGAHYYRNLEPYQKMLGYVNGLLQVSPESVYILTSVDVAGDAVYYEFTADKIMWVQEYLPGLPPDHFLVVGCRCPRAGCTTKSMAAVEILGRPLGKKDYLYDDFNRNLEEWQDAGGTPVKVLNGLNTFRGDMRHIYAI